MLGVLVVSDHPVVRAGLAALVGAAANCQVAGQCGLAELPAQAAALRPDVVLLDATEADAGALEALARFTAAEPAIEVLAVSRAGGVRARTVLLAGARGYLLWDAAGEELAAALQAVAQGLTVLHPTAARQLLGEAPSAAAALAPAGEPMESLSPRELEVLALLAQGLPSKVISARLHLSEHTVKFHVGSILAKLGAASRTEAVTIALRRGLLVL